MWLERPILMLDIDGVLNSVAWFTTRGTRTTPHLVHRDEWDFDPEACVHLEAICQQSNCLIVISSSWRILYTLDEIRALLRLRGVTAPVIGKTPELDLPRPLPGCEDKFPRSRWHRGTEIQHWLRTFIPAEDLPNTCVAILDDDGDMGDMRGSFVQTRNANGLTALEVPYVVKYLSMPLLMQESAGGRYKMEWELDAFDDCEVHRPGQCTVTKEKPKMPDTRPVFEDVWKPVLDQWVPTKHTDRDKVYLLRHYLLISPLVNALEDEYLAGNIPVAEVLNALREAEEYSEQASLNIL